MEPSTSFVLSKGQLSAIFSFAGSRAPVLFAPEAEDPSFAGGKAQHIVSTDGHTLCTYKDTAFEGGVFRVSREVLGLLKGAIPVKGHILLAASGEAVDFQIHRKDYEEPVLRGSFPPAVADEKFEQGYVEYGEHKIPKSSGGKAALQTKFLSRLEALRKATPHPCMGAQVRTGGSELDPTHFLFSCGTPRVTRWHVVIMPYRI